MPWSARRYTPPHRKAGPSPVRRPSSSERGYDANWRRLRLLKLRASPMCEAEGCTAVAQHVDHVVALEHGGTNEDGNLRSLCHSCHSRRTVRDQQGGRVGGKRVPRPGGGS
jgi:5-methylcytosine-specific restriction protein A